MEETNRVYRIRTKVGENAPNVIYVPLKQTYDMFEILSLKIDQKNTYKTYQSDYGIIVGRVTANGGFGIPNAKVSVFIEVSDEDSLKDKLLYNFTSTSSTDNKNIRYNLLPDYVDDACHQNVGTFPNKRLVLDNQDVIDMFDKYWKYTTTTNSSGDYFIFGVPVGSQVVHSDVDLSDCGILSQRPRDMFYKGYNEEMFESPNKFRTSTNLNSLVQIVSQDKSVYVYPYWGDISNGDEQFAITRCDINVEYKFEPTAIFMGSIITDKGANAIGKNCTGTENNGRMSDLISGEGTIEMIRKTVDNKVEEFPIKGNRLIDSDGVWCYQIPMNLDYVVTDEFGNTVPTDNPEKGIPTRARVRFRISLDENPNDATARKRAKYLVPNNPRMGEGGFDDELEADYEFGSATREESYCDLFWNKVYTVKNYIPKLQKNSKETNRKHTGIKLINHYGDNNPMPYNALTIKLSFTYRIICTITKVIINLIEFLNEIISLIGAILCLLIKIIELPGTLFRKIFSFWPVKKVGKLLQKGWNSLFSPVTKLIRKIMPNCIGLSSEFCDDGINQVTYYPGCGYFFFRLFSFDDIDLDCVWEETAENHEKNQLKICENEKKTKEECEMSLTVPTNKTAMLYNCIENQLAQQNDAISFNFYNDWINGTLYAPLWYRKIRPKRRYLFGFIQKKAKDDWCSANKTFPGMRILQQCAVSRDKSITYQNFDGEDVDLRYVEDFRCKKDKECHHSYKEVKGMNGVIQTNTTMLGQTVYYYKAVEHDTSLPKNYTMVDNQKKYVSDKNGEVKLLFATDIVLLGSLNECDLQGVPQFFKSLESTTFNMPSDILFTDYDFIMGVNKDGETERVETTVVDVVKTSEMAGCDWGNPNEFNKYDGGLFYSIGCTSSSTELSTKSCINLARICEYGVSLDETKEVANLSELQNTTEEQIDSNTNKSFERLITDGFISWDELYNLDERAMFATMNGNNLKTKLNEKNALKEYDFRYLYPENFDGSLRKIMKDRTEKYDYEINYKNNWKLENVSKDYYRFRMGNKPYFYDMDDTYAFPRYENSFYFYFGLKAGKTAIEKFNSKYFSECYNTDTVALQIGVKSQANSWCSQISNDGQNDGYLALDLSSIQTPYDLLINGISNGAFSLSVNNITEEKIIFINDDSQIPSKFNDYVQMKGTLIEEDEENEDYIYDFSDDTSITVIPMLNNGSYQGSITDANGNITEFTFKINGKYLSYKVTTTSFEQPNNVLMEMFINEDKKLEAIASNRDGLITSDVKNVTRDIGGVVSVFDIFMNAENLDFYTLEIRPKDETPLAEEYDGLLILYKEGIIYYWDIADKDWVRLNTSDSCYKDLIFYDSNHHYAFGVPKADCDYTVTITQRCAVDGNEFGTDSGNSVSSDVFVSGPMPYKMYINDIDYDLIKNFDNNTGWNLSGTVSSPNANQISIDDTVDITNNPWFKIDNIFYKTFTAPGHNYININDNTIITEEEYNALTDAEKANYQREVIDYTNHIVQFFIKRENNTKQYYEINNPSNIISENEYYALTTEQKRTYKEIYTLYALTDNGDEYEVSEEDLLREYTTNQENTDVPYNWVDDYIVKEYTGIDNFISLANKALNLRKDLRQQMKKVFYMSCAEDKKKLFVRGQTNNLPCTQTIVYHPEKTDENTNTNVLDGDNLKDEDMGSVTEIMIPTITYNNSVNFGNGGNDDTPCLVTVDGKKKKPYSVGIMNNSKISIPKKPDGTSFDFVEDNGAKYIKHSSTDIIDLFSFPIIDKILNVDYIAWSAFVNIPKYGYYTDINNGKTPYKETVTMNGLLAGVVYNGNVTDDKFDTQTLNSLDLKLSPNINANNPQTYVEKRIINGFNYEDIGNKIITLLEDYIEDYITIDIINKINEIFGLEDYPIIDTSIPDFEITEEIKEFLLDVISSLTVENNSIVYRDENNVIQWQQSIDAIIKYVLNFTNYIVDSNVDGTTQYAFLLPMQTLFLLQDQNGCGTQETLEGDLVVTLSNESVNNCKTKEKIVKFESDDSTYFSIFKINTDVYNYPLNKATNKNIFSWQITDGVNGIYDENNATQNLFSYQMKTDYLRGKNDLIDTDFVSEELISADDEEEEYATTRGYGTTGEFIYRPIYTSGDFDYPIFIVAETDNHVRALSPVYDYSYVEAIVKYGIYERKEAIEQVNPKTGDVSYTIGNTIEDYKFGIAYSNEDNHHYYLDNYSYKLSGTCKIDSVNTIEVKEETLTEPNQFVFTSISQALYETLQSKFRSIIGQLLNDIVNNTTIAAIDYTGLKHICGISSHGFKETRWYTYIWKGNLPLQEGQQPGIDTCGIRVNGEFLNEIEFIYETNQNPTVPEMYFSPEFDEVFVGWCDAEDAEDAEANTITEPLSRVTTSKVFYAKWNPVITHTVTFVNKNGQQISTQTVQHGDSVTQPDGYDSYWYKDGDSTKAEVEFPYTVTRDITFKELNVFTVRWCQEFFNVKFYDSDEETPISQDYKKQVEKGELVTPPTGCEGYSWYVVDDVNKTEIDLNEIPITQDISFAKYPTYTVRWVENDEE